MLAGSRWGVNLAIWLGSRSIYAVGRVQCAAVLGLVLAVGLLLASPAADGEIEHAGATTIGEPTADAGGQWMQVTAYGPGCGASGRTASGTWPRLGTAAAPRNLAFGTRLWIEGYGYAVVEDRGGAIWGNRLDVFMDCRSAIQWGRRWVLVYRVDWVEEIAEPITAGEDQERPSLVPAGATVGRPLAVGDVRHTSG